VNAGANEPTLVLIPGLMCDQAVWSGQLHALSGRVSRLRIAEHGYADSLPQMASSVLADTGGPLLLAGHSMGGRVALEIARRAGERLRGLALLDTGFRAVAAGEAGTQEIQGRRRLLDQAQREGVRSMAAIWVRGMVHPDRLSDSTLIDAIIDMFARRSAAHFAAQVKALIERPDAATLLPQLRCPTLLLCGQQDGASPPAQHQEMAALIPDSRLLLVPDCGHMSPMERPAAVAAALGEWLERCLA
jgi:pimeloyl-ACP methyl ester carboxylesterase